MTNTAWTSAQIPDQTGKTAIVTGANSGIGFETARELARKGASVILACRDPGRGAAAIEAIKSELPEARVELATLDLGSLASVRAFAEGFRQGSESLDLLINNAGVMMPPYGKTEDGFELQIGINHLGHFALTGLLLDRLLATPGARVVTVSSGAHRWGGVDLKDLSWEKKRYSKMKSYGQSKLANLLFTFELQRRLAEIGAEVIAVAAHPGWSATNLQKNSGMGRLLNPIFAQGQDKGAWPTLYAATAPEVGGGEYFGPGGWMEMGGHPKRVDSNDASKDADHGLRLWRISEELVDVRFSIGGA